MKKKEEEVSPVNASNLPVVRTQTALQQSNFRATKRLTRDVTSITRLGQVILQTQSELYALDMDDPANPGEKRAVPCVDIWDCITGEEYVLICGAVLASTWRRYNGALSGNYFAIQSGEIAPGKRYRKVDVVALERME